MTKRMTILGAGESGIGAALLGKAKGYDVFVSDRDKIKPSYREELERAEIVYEEGGHNLDKILEAELVVKSPGIPFDVPVVQEVSRAGIEIIDEIEWAYRHTSGSCIAITGTNGKTTTALLTYHLMKQSGMKVALVGNVGYSFARVVADREYDWYVVEISSFQLDGINSFSPVLAVLLNITQDHLNRYNNSFQEYIQSKFQLILHMKPEAHFIYFTDDVAIAKEVINRKVVPIKMGMSLQSGSDVPIYSDGDTMHFHLGEEFSIQQSETTLKGEHNLINTMASVSVAYLAGVELATIKKGLKTFKNAPHRLEFIARIKGVDFINDSKATNLDSVIYALGSYQSPMVWIAGGIDKGNDYTQVTDMVKGKVHTLICLGIDNEKLKKAFANIIAVIVETQDMRDLVQMAMKAANQGDVVLLSPACASFDLFSNYEDRGDQFRKAVLALKEEMDSLMDSESA